MNTTPAPQSSGPQVSLVLVLLYLADKFGESLNSAIAERFLDWILTQDWAALIEWCLSQAPRLPWL